LKFGLDLNTGKGFVTLKQKEKLSIQKLETSTKSAGFKLAHVGLEVTGSIQKSQGAGGEPHFSLHLKKRKQDIALKPGASKKQAAAFKLLVKQAGKKKRVKLEGPASESKQQGLELSVTSWKVEPQPPAPKAPPKKPHKQGRR